MMIYILIILLFRKEEVFLHNNCLNFKWKYFRKLGLMPMLVVKSMRLWWKNCIMYMPRNELFNLYLI